MRTSVRDFLDVLMWISSCIAVVVGILLIGIPLAALFLKYVSWCSCHIMGVCQ